MAEETERKQSRARESRRAMKTLNAGREPMEMDAILSDDLVHRFKLMRIWDRTLPALDWVLHNPSKADAKKDDPTVRKVIGFSRSLGYGGCNIYNGIAARATFPKELEQIPFASNENERYLYELCHREYVICAWGNTDWTN